MPTTERQQPVAAVEGARGIAEAGAGAQSFGRRRPASNYWQPQDRFLLMMLLPPLIEVEEDVAPVVMGSDEVSLEKVSLASGPAVIEITDEQAQQIIQDHGEDAYPPQ